MIPGSTDTASAPPAGGALERCVGDIDRFETRYWGREPFVRTCAGEGFDAVWSIAALDEMIVGGIRRPLVRLVQNGEPIAGDRYTSRVRLGGSDFGDVIDPRKTAELFAAGATIVAQSIHRTHPTVRRFAEELADEISHPIQANSYLTPAGAVGLAPHTDRHDVFVLQIEGSKSWSIAGLGDVELRAGDTAYIPAGTQHSAASTTATSLHLTIGVLRVTYRAVIERIVRSGPVALDDPLPLRYRSAAVDLHPAIEKVIADVTAHLGSIDPAEIAKREVARRPARPPRAGAITAAVELSAAMSAIGAETTLVRSDDDWSFSEPTAGRVEITTVDARLSAPASCRAALERLDLDGHASVAELVGLDAESQVILARRLVAAGLCHCDDRDR